jgi:GTPase Era involved in 16S rRNA processing
MEVLIMELNDKTKNFLDFTKKIMVSRDGKKQVIVNNKLEEIKYKNLKFQDR